jgi:hypothetical protein
MLSVMTTAATAERADLASIRTEIPEVARFLRDHLGMRITAYLAGLKKDRTVQDWVARRHPPRESAEYRLRAAYHAALLLLDSYDDETTRAWFFGAPVVLDGQAPAYVLRHAKDPEDTQRVIAAARAFAGGGH